MIVSAPTCNKKLGGISYFEVLLVLLSLLILFYKALRWFYAK